MDEEITTTLTALLNTALTQPEKLTSLDLQALKQVLADCGQNDNPDLPLLALASLNAVIYSRADIVQKEIVDSMRTMSLSTHWSNEIHAALARTLFFLQFTPAAANAVALILDGLKRANAPPFLHRQLLVALRDSIHWHPDRLDPDAILTLAEHPWLSEQRAFILDYLLERYVFLRPDYLASPAVIKGMLTIFATEPRIKYTLTFLREQLALNTEARTQLDHALSGQFTLREHAALMLNKAPFALLMVVNSRFGQGDEIVRTAALLQAVLDANPEMSVTLVSKRPYLYDHPRIRTYQILDDDEIQQVLDAEYDGVVNFFEPKAAHCNWRAELEPLIAKYIERQRPGFVLYGDHLDHRFAYQSLCLDGPEKVEALGLDQQLLDNIYEPSLRLLAELGLPMRFGEHSGDQSPPVLVTEPSVDAERIWDALLEQCADARKVALVNPFGGATREKGYTNSHLEQLAEEFAGLITEGYHLILLPNGTPWGSRRIAEAAIQALATDMRRYVSIAPDPADTRSELQLHERPNLPHADRIMRLFKYFAARADLIITVEGWLSHLAYHLGRPFRLILMAHSYPHPWYPHARGPQQQLAIRMSPLTETDNDNIHLLIGSPEAPFPRQPQREMLQLCLTLAASAGPEVIPLLLAVLTSADYQLRRQAVSEMGRYPQICKAHLLTALNDKEKSVRAEAAAILLREEIDCQRELGPRYPDLMRAHIAAAQEDWAELQHLGMVALPVLKRVARDRDPSVRAAAKRLTLSLLQPHLRSPG